MESMRGFLLEVFRLGLFCRHAWCDIYKRCILSFSIESEAFTLTKGNCSRHFRIQSVFFATKDIFPRENGCAVLSNKDSSCYDILPVAYLDT